MKHGDEAPVLGSMDQLVLSRILLDGFFKKELVSSGLLAERVGDDDNTPFPSFCTRLFSQIMLKGKASQLLIVLSLG